MDADTQARYRGRASLARPPTLAELRSAVAALARRIDETRAQGHRNVLYVYFSGHGSIVEGKGAVLSLLDGGITQGLLYDEILSKLSADYVHLFVDACHAEAVVRPRDTDARVVKVSPGDADLFRVRSTLARFPHVGAIVAASGDAQTHEWDLLGHGVFTHELLSALRGAADVNRDGRIEYSEIYAFLGAANRAVDDSRARLAVIARPPALDRRIAVLDLASIPPATTARLRDVPARAGLVEVEDGFGRRLASLRGEPSFRADLLVTAGRLYVRAGSKEAVVDAQPGQAISFDSLDFREREARPRGALEDAVRRGLFASEFGRGYYAGFIDQSPEFTPVSFGAEEPVRIERVARPDSASARRSSPAAVAVGLGVSSAVADTFDFSPSVRMAVRSPGARGLAATLDLSRAAANGVSETRAILSAGWLLSTSFAGARGWVGALAGGGFITQTNRMGQSLWSGVAGGGPVVGASVDLGRSFSLWTEAQLSALLCRLESSVALSWAPSAFLGVSLDL
jgi:hypothetical protein